MPSATYTTTVPELVTDDELRAVARRVREEHGITVRKVGELTASIDKGGAYNWRVSFEIEQPFGMTDDVAMAALAEAVDDELDVGSTTWRLLSRAYAQPEVVLAESGAAAAAGLEAVAAAAGDVAGAALDAGEEALKRAIGPVWVTLGAVLAGAAIAVGVIVYVKVS